MWRLFMMTSPFRKRTAKGIRAIARKTLLEKVWQKGYALPRVKYKNKYKINMFLYLFMCYFIFYLCVILFFIYLLFMCYFATLFPKVCVLGNRTLRVKRFAYQIINAHCRIIR